MKKICIVLAITLVTLSMILSGCQTAKKVPGVTAIQSAISTIVPPATALNTIMPTATASIMPTATVTSLATATAK